MTERQADGHAHLYYPPILNGLDYLDSVVDHLSGEPNPRNLKYAVLHLQAATEVLLKARLLQEHWSLVFKDPGRADRGRFESGAFESCATSEAIIRLRNILAVELPKSATDEISQLTKWRNALQHYGLIAPAPAVESRAAHILDFLLLFINEYLMPGLSGEDAEYAYETAYHIRSRLSHIRALIQARMDRLSPVLAPHAERTVSCPDCGQLALVVGSAPLRCRFCDEEHRNPVNLAQFYVGIALGKEWEPGYEDLATWPIQRCPGCAEDTLVLEAGTAAAPRSHTPLCFACGGIFPTGG
ncbi:hypothetical protein [Microtetraspora glauca]|uniref:Uncharacterized protein n=1 Tax=Microtetraspora glauca TaxID=1996 RepID=A0ABV3GT29_MICGL